MADMKAQQQYEQVYLKQHIPCCGKPTLTVTSGGFDGPELVKAKYSKGCCGFCSGYSMSTGTGQHFGTLKRQHADGGSSWVYHKAGQGKVAAASTANAGFFGGLSRPLGCCSCLTFRSVGRVPQVYTVDLNTKRDMMSMQTRYEFGEYPCCDTTCCTSCCYSCWNVRVGSSSVAEVLGPSADGSPHVGHLATSYIPSICCAPVYGGIADVPVGTSSNPDALVNWITLWHMSAGPTLHPRWTPNMWKHSTRISSLEQTLQPKMYLQPEMGKEDGKGYATMS